MPKKPGSHHVVPNADGGWDAKKDGATRSSSHFDKKQDAVDAGRKISQNQSTEFLHPRQGWEDPEQGQPRERSVSAEGVMRESIRFPFWEPNWRPKTGFEVVAAGR